MIRGYNFPSGSAEKVTIDYNKVTENLDLYSSNISGTILKRIITSDTSTYGYIINLPYNNYYIKNNKIYNSSNTLLYTISNSNYLYYYNQALYSAKYSTSYGSTTVTCYIYKIDLTQTSLSQTTYQTFSLNTSPNGSDSGINFQFEVFNNILYLYSIIVPTRQVSPSVAPEHERHVARIYKINVTNKTSPVLFSNINRYFIPEAYCSLKDNGHICFYDKANENNFIYIDAERGQGYNTNPRGIRIAKISNSGTTGTITKEITRPIGSFQGENSVIPFVSGSSVYISNKQSTTYELIQINTSNLNITTSISGSGGDVIWDVYNRPHEIFCWETSSSTENPTIMKFYTTNHSTSGSMGLNLHSYYPQIIPDTSKFIRVYNTNYANLHIFIIQHDIYDTEHSQIKECVWEYWEPNTTISTLLSSYEVPYIEL